MAGNDLKKALISVLTTTKTINKPEDLHLLARATYNKFYSFFINNFKQKRYEIYTEEDF